MSRAGFVMRDRAPSARVPRHAFVAACAALILGMPSGAMGQAGDLSRCLASIRATQGARRITADTWTRHAASLEADPRVVAALDAQPEFRLPVWDYMAVMVDDERIDDGRNRLVLHRPLLESIFERYGVEPQVLVAFWGVESNYGRGMGSYGVLRSLATLSCKGRRQKFFRGQFLAALRIVQDGHVAPARFRGSWAGAFGQTQFMPGTFEWLAVDHDGDGRRDVIGNVGDALASTANYLRRHGWRTGAPWGIEVKLPGPAFPVRGEGRRVKRTLDTWAARGVVRADGSPLAGDGLSPATRAGLYLPAGATGPAFLTFHNFDVIYRYNASETYSLAIAHLADRLRGGGPFATPWPTDDPGLSRAERRELQRLLAARGHDIGAPSGVLTARTRAAVRREQERLGHEVTGRPGQKLLRALRNP